MCRGIRSRVEAQSWDQTRGTVKLHNFLPRVCSADSLFRILWCQMDEFPELHLLFFATLKSLSFLNEFRILDSFAEKEITAFSVFLGASGASGTSGVSALLWPGYNVSIRQQHKLKSEQLNPNWWMMFPSDSHPFLSLPPFMLTTSFSGIFCASVSVSRCDRWFVLDVVSAPLRLDSAAPLHPHVSHKGVKTNRGRAELLLVHLLWVAPAQVVFLFCCGCSLKHRAKKQCYWFLLCCCVCLPTIMNLNVFLWFSLDHVCSTDQDRHKKMKHLSPN